jgi:hypothetical protein
MKRAILSTAYLAVSLGSVDVVLGQTRSVELFTRTRVMETAEDVSFANLLPFRQAENICLDLSPDTTVLLSSTEDGTGGIVIDNFLRVDGQNICQNAPGQIFPESCFGPQFNPNPQPGDDIRDVLTEIPPVNLTPFLVLGRRTYTFELMDFGIIAGNTPLHLVVQGPGGFCTVVPPGPDLTVDVVCDGREVFVLVRNLGQQASEPTQAFFVLQRVTDFADTLADFTPNVPRIPGGGERRFPPDRGIPLGQCPEEEIFLPGDPEPFQDRCDFSASVDDVPTSRRCRVLRSQGVVCELDELNNTDFGTIGQNTCRRR